MVVDDDIIDEYYDEQSTDNSFEYRNGELVGGQELEQQQREQQEQQRLNTLGSTRQVDAKIGPLVFVGDFTDPDVNVVNTRETVEHDVISGVSEFGSDEEFVVQPKGEKPTEIEVVGWIREGQLDVADEELITSTLVGVRTGRWKGTAVVTDVDIDYSRVYHEHHGPIFETTISLLAIRRGELPSGFSEDIEDQTDTIYRLEDGEYVGGRELLEKQAKQTEDQRLKELFSTMDVSCVIGDLRFVSDFKDPTVNVTHSRETTDHEVVIGHDAYRDNDIEFVTQVMGRNPTELDIEGWIREDQLETADALTEFGETILLSGRWSGTVVPLDVDVDYTRNIHEHHGALFEVTINLLGIQKGVLPETIPEEARQIEEDT